MNAVAPVISIILPVHNGAGFVDEAVRSMLQQSESRFELLLVDDGSSDGSAEILRRLALEDRRIRLEIGPMQGLSRVCNLAAQRARGAFLARMDADDVALRHRLAAQLAWMQSHAECVALGGQALRIDAEGWPIDRWEVPQQHEDIDAWHLRGLGGGIIHPTAMIRKAAFDKVGGYEECLDASQDYDLWLKLAEVGRLGNLADVVLYYRLHAASVTSSRRLRQARCIELARERALVRRALPLEPPPALRVRSDLTPSGARRQWVRLALRSGHYATALKHARLLWQETRPSLVSLTLLLLASAACRCGPGSSGGGGSVCNRLML